MAANATFALKPGLCVRRTRLVMVAPDTRHSRRSQAEIPLIDLSEFGQPPLKRDEWIEDAFNMANQTDLENEIAGISKSWSNPAARNGLFGNILKSIRVDAVRG